MQKLGVMIFVKNAKQIVQLYNHVLSKNIFLDKTYKPLTPFHTIYDGIFLYHPFSNGNDGSCVWIASYGKSVSKKGEILDKLYSKAHNSTPFHEQISPFAKLL
jgi:hypothetical protein